jgi:hypothetical protein
VFLARAASGKGFTGGSPSPRADQLTS